MYQMIGNGEMVDKMQKIESYKVSYKYWLVREAHHYKRHVPKMILLCKKEGDGY